MAPKKLTEADKTSILKLYREPEETTSTLADRYGVSNSTISRLLKASLPAQEYGRLIQQKRSTADKSSAGAGKAKVARKAEVAPQPSNDGEDTPDNATDPAIKDATDRDQPPAKADKPAPVLKKRDKPETPAPAEAAATSQPATDDTETSAAPTRTRRRSSKPKSAPAAKSPQVSEDSAQLSLPDPDLAPEPPEPSAKEPPKLKSERLAAADDEEGTDNISNDWDDVSSLDDDYDEDDEDDEDDDDFEDDGESWDGGDADAAPHLEKLEISPLTDASLPRLCYVVVERSSSELVVLPLRTFAHLGEIPEAEGESRTLPVFDNHRVARRFSRRNQRVVKLPDGGLLQTTSPYLMAKGITRLLIDGQVFTLDSGENGYAEAADRNLE